MTLRPRRKSSGTIPALSVALFASLAAYSATAQSGFVIRTQNGGERAFAEPLFWLNATSNDRLPIRERPLIPQAGLTAQAPPSPRRAGLTPWVSSAVEINNSGASGDRTLTFAPGFSYRYQDRRLLFDASYAVEAGLHLRRTDFSGFHGQRGFVNLSYAFDDRSQLSFTNVFSDTLDLRSAPIPGQLAAGTRLLTNTAIAGYKFSPTQRSLLDIAFANTNYWVIAPGGNNIVENALSFRYQFVLSPTSSVTASSNLGWVDFGTVGVASHVSADIGYTRDLGSHLSFNAKLGLLGTSENGGQTLPNVGAELIHTNRFAEYRLSVSRDIIVVPGLVNLARIDAIEGRALMRLDRGLILDLALGLQELEVYDAVGAETSVASASGKLSYALRDNMWVWAQIELQRENSGGATQTDHRLNIGLTRGF